MISYSTDLRDSVMDTLRSLLCIARLTNAAKANVSATAVRMFILVTLGSKYIILTTMLSITKARSHFPSGIPTTAAIAVRNRFSRKTYWDTSSWLNPRTLIVAISLILSVMFMLVRL